MSKNEVMNQVTFLLYNKSSNLQPTCPQLQMPSNRTGLAYISCYIMPQSTGLNILVIEPKEELAL